MPSVYAMTSSASTRERRRGISTVDPLAVQAVGALTADLDGRRRRDRQLDVAAEGRERGLELGRPERLVPLERARPPDRPVVVVQREIDVREVALVEPTKHDAMLVSPDRTTGAAAPSRTGRACRRGRSSRRVRRRTLATTIANDDGPAGLSTRMTPVGSSPFGIAISGRRWRAGTRRARTPRTPSIRLELAREARRLPVTAAARLRARSPRRRARRSTTAARPCAPGCRPGGGSRISAASSVPSTARRSSMIALRVRLLGADLGEVRRASDARRRPGRPRGASARSSARASSFTFANCDRLVHPLEDARDVRAGLDQLGREPERLRRRVRVLEAPGVGDERRVERLRDRRRQRRRRARRRRPPAPRRSTTRRRRRGSTLAEARVVVVVVDVDDDAPRRAGGRSP